MKTTKEKLLGRLNEEDSIWLNAVVELDEIFALLPVLKSFLWKERFSQEASNKEKNLWNLKKWLMHI